MHFLRSTIILTAITFVIVGAAIVSSLNESPIAAPPPAVSTSSAQSLSTNPVYYEIVRNHVYWIDPFNSTDSVDLSVEYGTDAGTFRAINPTQKWRGSHTGVYAKDRRGVYFQYQLISGADPNTFIVVNSENALSKDTYQVYIRAEAYPQLSPASVHFLGGAGRIFYLSSGSETFLFDQALDRLQKTRPQT
jgi:DKNYY family protein